MNRAPTEERIQRIRIGLTGLAFVFLLVLLGTAVSRSSEDSDAPPAHNELVTNEMPTEPLAEIGAAPGATAPENEAGEPAPAKAP